VDGKKKAQGGTRVMYAEHHACWDAKNRFGLPGEMPLEFAKIAGIFDAPAPAPTSPAPARVTLTEPPAQAAPEPPKSTAECDPEKTRLLNQLAELMVGSKVSKEVLGAELARKGVVPAEMSPRDYNVATLKRVVAGWTAITHNIELKKGQAA
jgi:hypothetical protein